MIQVKTPEKRLRALFAKLSESDQKSVLDFAEYLADRPSAESEEEAPPAEPLDIPRPEKESVIGAVKRLSATYAMLDKSKMLHETSSLVSQHLIQGRSADEVVDELELVFEQHYRRHMEEREG